MPVSSRLRCGAWTFQTARSRDLCYQMCIRDRLKTAVPECMDAVWKRLKLAQVTFHFVEGEKTLYTDNILYVESRRHKSIFHYMESSMTEYQIYSKLDEIEQKLYEHGFLRIHKSYLVNMKHMRRVSNYEAMLDNGCLLYTSTLRMVIRYPAICTVKRHPGIRKRILRQRRYEYGQKENKRGYALWKHLYESRLYFSSAIAGDRSGTRLLSHDHATVSYTHLDVYKRQLQGWQPRWNLQSCL